MRAEEAPRVDDGCLDVGRPTVRRPHHVPVALRFQHGVEKVDVPLREDLGGGRLRPIPGERGQVGDLDRGHGVEGEALFQVIGGAGPAGLDPRPGPGVLNQVSIVQRPPYRSRTVAANTAPASPSAGRSVVGSGQCAPHGLPPLPTRGR